MDNPQERVIKKMINNIVEQNKPVFEKPGTASSSAAPSSSSSSSHNMSAEDMTVITRKIEYGFNNMRTENAELRKGLEEIGGMLKMLRNDMDSLRMSVQQASRGNSASQPMGHASPAPAAPRGAPVMGAPQYKKSEADEAYERQSGQAAHEEEPQQARGFAKKEEKPAGETIDISKVFYYGKK